MGNKVVDFFVARDIYGYAVGLTIVAATTINKIWGHSHVGDLCTHVVKLGVAPDGIQRWFKLRREGLDHNLGYLEFLTVRFQRLQF